MCVWTVREREREGRGWEEMEGNTHTHTHTYTHLSLDTVNGSSQHGLVVANVSGSQTTRSVADANLKLDLQTTSAAKEQQPGSVVKASLVQKLMTTLAVTLTGSPCCS